MLSGKSTFRTELLRKFRNDDEFIPVSVDFTSLPKLSSVKKKNTVKRLSQLIARSMLLSLPKDLETRENISKFEQTAVNATSFLQLTKAIIKFENLPSIVGKAIVILVDNVELISDSLQIILQNFLRSIHEERKDKYIGHMRRVGLIYFCETIYPKPDSLRSFLNSPLANVSSIFELPPLNKQCVFDYINRSATYIAVTFTEDALEEIYTFASGSLAISNAIARIAAEHSADSDIDEKQIKQSELRFLRSASSIATRILSTKTSRDGYTVSVIAALTRGQHIVANENSEGFKRLVRGGIVRVNKNDEVSFSSIAIKQLFLATMHIAEIQDDPLSAHLASIPSVIELLVSKDMFDNFHQQISSIASWENMENSALSKKAISFFKAQEENFPIDTILAQLPHQYVENVGREGIIKALLQVSGTYFVRQFQQI